MWNILLLALILWIIHGCIFENGYAAPSSLESFDTKILLLVIFGFFLIPIINKEEYYILFTQNILQVRSP